MTQPTFKLGVLKLGCIGAAPLLDAAGIGWAVTGSVTGRGYVERTGYAGSLSGPSARVWNTSSCAAWPEATASAPTTA